MLENGAASREQIACDYIAGMTDSYAVHTFEEYFVPKHGKLEKLKEIRKFCRIYINREYFEYSQRLEKRMQQIYVLSRRINRGSTT